jgi:hypothetical protein
MTHSLYIPNISTTIFERLAKAVQGENVAYIETHEDKISLTNLQFLNEIKTFEQDLKDLPASVSDEKRLQLMRPFEQYAAQLAFSKGWHLETDEAETPLIRNIKIRLSILENKAGMRHKMLNINDFFTEKMVK